MRAVPLLESTARPVGWTPAGPIAASTFLGDVEHLVKRLPRLGDAILNVCEDRHRFLVTLAAGLVSGRPNLLPPSTAPEVLKQIAAERSRPVCVTDGVACPPGYPRVDYREAPGSGTPSDRIPVFPDDRLMLEVFTSGSTGQPQAHPKRWRELYAGATLTGRRFGLDVGEPGALVATVPPQHMFGLESSVMLALRWGWAAHTWRPFFPTDVAKALADVPGPRILITTPLHIRACLSEQVELPELAFILSATAPLSTEIARAAEARFACPVREIYGSTETGAMATRRPAQGAAWRPIEGFRLRRGERGWLAQASHLPAPVVLGDRLEDHGDGTFGLLGRTADLVKIAGKRASLGDLNQKLLSIDGVEDGSFVVPAEGRDAPARLAAVVVAPTLTKGALLQELRKRVDPAFLPRRLQLVAALPRNASGKLPRGELLKLLAKD